MKSLDMSRQDEKDIKKSNHKKKLLFEIVLVKHA